MKNSNGITLVAMVVTMIVLLILAGVTINMTINGDSLFSKARKAVDAYNSAAAKEEKALEEYMEYFEQTESTYANYDKTGKEEEGNNTNPEIPQETLISKTTSESFVGRYADINGDGTIDGIIYIDLLAQAGQSRKWNNDLDCAFTITSTVTSSNVKDYVISQTAQKDTRFDNTERDVIRLATVQTGTEDRFFVMGLDNIKDSSNNDNLCWYKSAYGKMENPPTVAPSTENVGTGRENTAAIKAKWDLGAETGGYGARNSEDLWGYMPNTPKAGANVEASASDTLSYRWFIPSSAEWCAFGYNLGIDKDSYESKGLSEHYWSSTQNNAKASWGIFFEDDELNYYGVYHTCCVRVSATF